MNRPAFVVTAAICAAGAVAIEHAQQRPQFRAGVEYVEVDARVVNENGEPIRNLAQQEFQLFEDGVRQDVTAFSVVDLPLPVANARPPAASLGIRPDVATNARPA